MRAIAGIDCPEVPWRNGLGTTRELFATPNLRVSLAHERADAAFSDFTGWSRTIVPLGDGLELSFEDGRRVALTSGRPFEFDGGLVVHSVVRTPLDAFNVMSRRVALEHRVDALDAVTQRSVAARCAQLLYVVQGVVTIAELELQAGVLAIATESELELDCSRLALSPDAVALAIFTAGRSAAAV
ncbi:MAG TPA: HutD family protein [Candidatus Dormibacteraeota bacterium]|nr:HutD family protein [Candidatus Dormibacteraeota bacterium]